MIERNLDLEKEKISEKTFPLAFQRALGVFMVCGLFLSACSHLKLEAPPHSKKFVIETNWISSAQENANTEYRRVHSMTPIITREFVFQGNGFDSMAAFNRVTGEKLWSFPVKNGVEAGATYSGKTLFFGGNDGFFYAVNSRTGKKLWSFDLRAQVISTPTYSNGNIYFSSSDNTIFSLNAKTGEQNWLYRRPESVALSVRGTSRPVAIGKKVFAGTTDGYLVSIDAEDGKLLWERQLYTDGRFTDVDSTPILDREGNIYVSSYDGHLYCLRASDGQINWRAEQGSHATVSVVNDRVFMATSAGEIWALKKDSGEVIWKSKVENGIATQPRFYRGLLAYGESSGGLVVIGSDDGKPIEDYTITRGISSPPKIDRKTGEIFFVSGEGNLYSLQLLRESAKRTWPWDSDRL